MSAKGEFCGTVDRPSRVRSAQRHGQLGIFPKFLSFPTGK